MKRNLLLTVFAVIAVAAIGGYYLYSKKTPDIVNDKAEATVTAKDLVAAFEKDTAAASKQYIDKIVEVTGNVKRIDTSGAVVFGEESSPSEVVVGLDRRHLKDVDKLKTGVTAVLQGICSGYQKSGSNDPTDLLSSLGTTVQLRSAGLKEKN